MKQRVTATGKAHEDYGTAETDDISLLYGPQLNTIGLVLELNVVRVGNFKIVCHKDGTRDTGLLRFSVVLVIQAS